MPPNPDSLPVNYWTPLLNQGVLGIAVIALCVALIWIAKTFLTHLDGQLALAQTENERHEETMQQHDEKFLAALARLTDEVKTGFGMLDRKIERLIPPSRGI